MKKLNFLRLAIPYGVYLGLGFCLYTTFMWLTKLDTTYLYIGQYFDMAIILLPMIIIFLAIKKSIALYRISIFQRIGISVFIGLISYIIYDPFLYAYHHYINPDWFAPVLHLKEIELSAANASKEETDQILREMMASNASHSGLFSLSALITSVIILPTVMALLSLVFIKNKPLLEIKE